MSSIEQLHVTLNERRRPEDVAEMIISLLDKDLNQQERSILMKAAKGSLARKMFSYTSMLQTFAAAVGAGKQVETAIRLFKLNQPAAIDYNDATNIERFIKFVSPIIHKQVGENDFKADRLNKEQRKTIGLDVSKRNYNKKWRLLKRLERKLTNFIQENRKIEFQKISKHGLAHTINLGEFLQDVNSACFIAYYTARCNVRSIFTNEKQERPFDEICDMLLKRCSSQHHRSDLLATSSKESSPMPANWWAIAHCYVSEQVLNHLDDEQKGILLGKWTSILQDIAALLEELWQGNDINHRTMIVKRGNDSTTWNNTAGAWNKARDNWMNLIYSMGLESILEDICFGKVLRLMAADVAAWHRASGKDLDPNTDVWAKLPLPWQVFQDTAICNKALVEKSCEEAGVDPIKSGWITPRIHGIVAFKPTPELVHGVAISSPYLATVLKKHKYYSGKKGKPFTPGNN
ncbi:hypothetical protein [Paraflavitalea sp. CAU 1676]|uniref:hypothetical protein n=1 Tax=Paraflavitalea sp. CAU 1676 TaxID=3032598 RepID=UPI0023D9DB40|nr:hypothetical protein [Paraflavitalea sp. CAU 1676]MDF2192733.1 hypothetical protein [Paraflavitalea sp. CAU 1676]